MSGHRRKAGRPKRSDARPIRSATFHGAAVAASPSQKDRACAEWNAARARLAAREKVGEAVEGTWSALADQLSLVAR